MRIHVGIYLLSGIMDFNSLASLAQFVKVGKETALIVEIHLVSLEGKYVWFKERHMQEVLVLAHQMLQQHSEKDKKDKYNFTRSGDIRVLYTLKQIPFTQHILVPPSDNANIPSSLPCCGLINVNGKRVIPYQSSYSQGIQYDCYKVLPLRLHMFIDCLELPSNQGVVKIRQSLVPDQHLSLDITSYFKNTLSNDSDEPLAPLPVSHLRRGNKTRRGQKQSLSFKNHQTSKVNKKMTTSPGQTTITDAFSGDDQKSRRDQKDIPSSSANLIESGYSSNIKTSFGNLLSCREKLSSPPPPLPPPLTTLNDPNGCHGNSDIEVAHTRVVLDEELTSSQELFDSPLSSQQENNDTLLSARKRLVPEDWFDDKAAPMFKISKVSYSQKFKSSSSSSWLSTRRTMFDSTLSSSKKEEKKIKKSSKLKATSCTSIKKNSFDILSEESSSDEKNEVLQVDNADLQALIKATSKRLKELSTNKEDISTEVPQISSIEMKEDTTLENDTIALSSEEEVSDYKPSWRTQCRAGPNRKAAFKKIFTGYNGIEDLSDAVLIKWLKIRKQTLVNILLGKTPSERHTLYKTGRKERASLQYSVSTVMLSWEQLQCITNGLYQIFCTKSEQYFNYLWLVLFPESVVHLIMDFHELNYDQAEQKMYNYYPIKSETFDEI